MVPLYRFALKQLLQLVETAVRQIRVYGGDVRNAIMPYWQSAPYDSGA